MASFTYTVWSPYSATEVIDKLRYVFAQTRFSLQNPLTGMCHTWDQGGNCTRQEVALLGQVKSEDLPLGIQWWRAEEDILVTLAIEHVVKRI
jgi:hypothetical protein